MFGSVIHLIAVAPPLPLTTRLLPAQLLLVKMAQQHQHIRRTGYAGFGSFMVDQSVEELVAAASQPGWQPPPNPCAAAGDGDAHSGGAEPCPALGAAMRSEFLIDFESWTFLNLGAFGSPLRRAQQEAAAWRERCERQPLAFLDRRGPRCRAPAAPCCTLGCSLC